MTTVRGVAPIVKEVQVPVPVERAFALFTQQFGVWWPLATHSVAETRAIEVVFETRLGGHITERTRDGDTHAWGTVTRWEPPEVVAFNWHPGNPEAEATEVSVRFSMIDGGTRVLLTHDGWERRPDGIEMREGYAVGWDVPLGRYVSATGS